MQPLSKTMASFTGGTPGYRKHACCVDCAIWRPGDWPYQCARCTSGLGEMPTNFRLRAMPGQHSACRDCALRERHCGTGQFYLSCRQGPEDVLPRRFVEKRSKQKMVYVIGSLRNPAILDTDKALQELLPGWRVFSDWMCAGPHADDAWRDHEKARGVGFLEALKRPAAVNVFEFDKKHLEQADAVVLVLPAGKSAHLELGWCLGKGKPGYILVDDPERWDVMYQFATGISTNIKEIAIWLQNPK